MINKISLKNVSKSFFSDKEKIDVLKDVSFDFKNAAYSVEGVSGSGKSTLLSLIAGLQNPTAGQIFFGEKNINQFSNQQSTEYLNSKIGLVFQEPNLLEDLTIAENIALKAFSRKSAIEQVIQLLKSIGLEEKANQFPNQLSGGQKQRVAVLRAIFNQPEFLIADEPTGNLDKKTGQELVDFLFSCKKEWGFGLIVCTHDKEISKKMDQRLYLQNGKLMSI